jgi:biopolymer transport protein ExbD
MKFINIIILFLIFFFITDSNSSRKSKYSTKISPSASPETQRKQRKANLRHEMLEELEMSLSQDKVGVSNKDKIENNDKKIVENLGDSKQIEIHLPRQKGSTSPEKKGRKNYEKKR